MRLLLDDDKAERSAVVGIGVGDLETREDLMARRDQRVSQCDGVIDGRVVVEVAHANMDGEAASMTRTRSV